MLDVQAKCVLLGLETPLQELGTLPSTFTELKVSSSDTSLWPDVSRRFDLIVLEFSTAADRHSLSERLAAVRGRLADGGAVILLPPSSGEPFFEGANWTESFGGFRFDGIGPVGSQLGAVMRPDSEDDARLTAWAVRGALEAIQAVREMEPPTVELSPQWSMPAIGDLLPEFNSSASSPGGRSDRDLARRAAKKAFRSSRALGRKQLLLVLLVALVLVLGVAAVLAAKFGLQALLVFLLIALTAVVCLGFLRQDRWNRRFNNRVRDVLGVLDEARDSVENSVRSLDAQAESFDARNRLLSEYVAALMIDVAENRRQGGL